MSNEQITLLCAGDVMLGEHPAMVGRGIATQIRRDPSFDVFEGIRHHIDATDYAIANLESPVSAWSPLSRPSSRECRGPLESRRTLENAGFDVLTVANNHSQQHGESAFNETVQWLKSAGMAVAGLRGSRPGRAEPVELITRNRRFVVLGYSLRPRQHFSKDPAYAEGTRTGILQDISESTGPNATVIVTLHWGDEFINEPSPEQVSLGREIIDAGATLVLGHHPHVLQPWEYYKHGAIIYSLGNLVFDMPWLHPLRQSAMAVGHFLDERVIVRWIPLVIGNDHRPRDATPAESKQILDLLGDGTPVSPLDPLQYSSSLDEASRTERWDRNRYFLRNLHRYPLDVSTELIIKFVARRLRLLND